MLWDCLKSEQLKFIYNRWVMIAAGFILIFIPVMVETLGNTLSLPLLEGFYLGQAGFAVLAALYFGHEYKRSALRTSILGIPGRIVLLASKYVIVIVWMAGLFLVDSVISVILTGGVMLSLVPGFISTLELTAITCALVVITKSDIVSMAIPVALILGLGTLLLQYGRIMRYLPVVSTLQAFFASRVPSYLSVTEGLWVQGIWAVILVALSFLIFWRRAVR